MIGYLRFCVLSFDWELLDLGNSGNVNYQRFEKHIIAVCVNYMKEVSLGTELLKRGGEM